MQNEPIDFNGHLRGQRLRDLQVATETFLKLSETPEGCNEIGPDSEPVINMAFALLFVAQRLMTHRKETSRG
jgi:hypothetical protein